MTLQLALKPPPQSSPPFAHGNIKKQYIVARRNIERQYIVARCNIKKQYIVRRNMTKNNQIEKILNVSVEVVATNDQSLNDSAFNNFFENKLAR